MEVVRDKKGNTPSLKKKVSRKFVKIQNSNMLEKQLVSKYTKWQRRIARWIKVDLADTYEYMYKIQYTGAVRLRENDVVFNSQQVLFVVVQEVNRMALIVTMEAYVNKPKVYDKLTILEKGTQQKTN